MAVLRINDLDLYYRERGSGPPLILLMGFSANSDWWPVEFVQNLSLHFRVLSIDNRGSGRTPPGEKRFTIAQAADDTVAFMDALGLIKAHVFGISMGGMIAQAMASRHCHRIDRLILGCTMPRPATGFIAGLKGQCWLLAQYIFNKRVRARPWIVNIMFSQTFLAKQPQASAAFITMISQARITPGSWLAQVFAMTRFNGLPSLHTIQHETLVIAGDQDQLISPRHSQRIAKALTHARLVLLPGLGHGFVGEAPDVTASHLIGFLSAPKTPYSKM